MNRTRSLVTLFVALSAVFALAVAGCKKEKKDAEATTTGDDKAGAATTKPGKTDKGRAAPGTGFAVFPKDVEYLVALSMGSLRKSGAWDKYRAQIEKQAEDMPDFRALCGYDVIGSFEGLIAGGKSDKEDELLVVVSGLERSRIETCVEKVAASEGEKIQLRQEGRMTHIKGADGDFWAAWLSDSAVLIGKEKAYVETRARGEDGLDKNKAFMDLLGQVDTSASFWLAGIPGAGNDLGSMMGMGKLEAVFASIKFDGGMKLDGGIRMGSAAEASGMATMAKQMLGMAAGQPQLKDLKKLLDKLVIKDQDRDVIVQLQLTEAELAELEKAAAGLGQMMGGGLF